MLQMSWSSAFFEWIGKYLIASSTTSPDQIAPKRWQVTDGVVLQPRGEGGRRWREFGAFDPHGRAVPYVDVQGSFYETRPLDGPDPVGEVPQLTGAWLFAGFAPDQFGHVLSNALGRLWALDHLPLDCGLYFLCHHRHHTVDLQNLKAVLEALGIRRRLHVSRQVERVDRLFTATDQFGERYQMRGSAAFYAWLDARLPQVRPQPGRKIYVSRSKLGQRMGRFACEDHLEALLAADGYEIFHPEQHSLIAQAAAYLRAERLIFAEGSALHYYALMRRPSQRFAILQRRPDLPALIQAQVHDRAGPPPLILNHIVERWWHPVRADHMAVSVLDFAQIRTDLVAQGFLSPDAPWSAPTEQACRSSLEAGLQAGETMLTQKQHQQFIRKKYR